MKRIDAPAMSPPQEPAAAMPPAEEVPPAAAVAEATAPPPAAMEAPPVPAEEIVPPAVVPIAAPPAGTQPPTLTAPPPVAVEEQVVEMYPWDKFAPSIFCRPFNFVLQLVMIAATGSFLFGFNIALLNTALAAVNSDFQMCGRLKPEAVLILRTPDPIATCALIAGCNDYCHAETTDGGAELRCNGGHADLDCGSLRWYNAFVTCAVLIGGAAGAMTAGRLTSHGRRTLLLIDMCIFGIGVISSVCANSFPALMWARLIVGYGVGVASVISPTYMAEITPASKRGKYGVFHQLCITVGILIAVVLGLPLTDPRDQPSDWEPPTFQRFWWRFMLGLGILPVVIGLYMLLFVYTFETPVWYVEHHRHRDAVEVLKRTHGKQDVTAELGTCVDNYQTGEDYKRRGLTFASAFQNPEYRWVIFVGIGLAAFQQFGGINVFTTSSNTLFAEAGLSGGWQTGMSVIMAGINVIMTFPTIILIETMGRKSLLLAGSTLQFVCLVPGAISYWIESDPDNPSRRTQILAIVAVIGFVVFFAVAFGPIVWVYLFEIYPLEIKDKAAGLATAFNWIAGIIMVFVTLVIPNQVAFTVFAVFQLLGTLFVLFFMRETKGLPLGTSPFITKKAGMAAAV